VPQKRSGVRVLVVDDSTTVRLVVRVSLETRGHSVLEAGSLAEARAQLALDGVDVVLVDVHVGEEDGLGLVRELAARGVRAMIVSGTMPIGHPYGAGEAAVLVKPFTPEALVAAVEGADPL
jgi:DNA-binding response OmpR family regulator